MSYLTIYNKKLRNGGYNTTGYNKYALTIQTNNGVTPTTNYYKEDNKGCNYTSKWDNENHIIDCIDCVSNYGFYGEKQIYCNGRCMSKYNLGETCSGGSLFSSNINNCFNPCYYSLPVLESCKNDYDCRNNETCGPTGFCLSNKKIFEYTGIRNDENSIDYSKIFTEIAPTSMTGTSMTGTEEPTSMTGTEPLFPSEIKENFNDGYFGDYKYSFYESKKNNKNKYIGVL